MNRNAAVYDEKELLTAATRMYHKQSGTDDQPSNDSGIEEHDEAVYVVFRSARGVMAVFRVDDEHRLERLADVPAFFNDLFAGGRAAPTETSREARRQR